MAITMAITLHPFQDSAAKAESQRNTCFTVFLFFPMVCMAICNAMVGHFVFLEGPVTYEKRLPNAAHYYLSAAYGLNYSLCVFSATIAAMYLNKLQFLGFVRLYLESLNKKLNNHQQISCHLLVKKVKEAKKEDKATTINKVEDGHPTCDIDHMFVLANEIKSMIDFLNELFGSDLFMESGIDLICESAGLYLSINIYSAFGGYQINPLMAVFGLMNVFTFVFYISKWFGITQKGQQIQKMFKEVKKTLQKMKLAHVTKLTVQQNCALDILIENYSVECPVRPLDIFNLNYSTALSAFGLCFTYVIVLLQFKVGEIATAL